MSQKHAKQLEQRQFDIEQRTLKRARGTTQTFPELGRLCEAIEDVRQWIIDNRSGRRPVYSLPLFALHGEELAGVTLREIMRRVLLNDADEPSSYSALAKSIGDACYYTWIDQAEQRELANVVDRLLQRIAAPGPADRKNIEAQVSQFVGEDWRDHAGARLGGVLLDLAEWLGFIHIEGEYQPTGARLLNRVYLGPAMETLLGTQRGPASGADPIEAIVSTHRPMIVPPRPWQGLQGGGFLTAASSHDPEVVDLVKDRGNSRRIEALETAHREGRLEVVYSAVNVLQATPWRLNERIYKVMSFARDAQLALPGFPDRTKCAELEEQKPLLELSLRELEQDVGKELRQRTRRLKNHPPTPATRRELDDAWGEYYAEKQHIERDLRTLRSLSAQQAKLDLLLGLCRQLQQDSMHYEHLALYFPYKLDYRGRAYPRLTLLNPQGNDHSRALLEFAHGEPVGPDGAYWLAVHTANNYGNGVDKYPFDDRVRWCEQHDAEIRGLAAMVSPDGGLDEDYIHRLQATLLEFWRAADNPWQFLAACFEWAEHRDEGFQSHIPVTLDATASGLQHLSALALDQDGATKTNLLPSDSPCDIYQEVADAVNKIIEQDARNDNAQALEWKDRVTRNVVKPAVMTTPYGITKDGRQQQIEQYIEKLEAAGTSDFSNPQDAARYLANKVGRSIKKTIPASVNVMSWLRKVAKTCAEEAASGVSWQTPTDFPVVVEEYATRTERPNWVDPRPALDEQGSRNAHPLRREYHLKMLEKPQRIEPDDQSRKVTANFVHSLDASHMTLTINALYRQKIGDIVAIHDGFGVHACHLPRLRRVLKEEFTRIYSDEPRLENFIAAQINALRATLPEDHSAIQRLEQHRCSMPIVGTLKLCDVWRSEYMFS